MNYYEELEKYKERAIEHNVCNEYLRRWNNSLSKKEFIDMALSSQGALFMAQSMNNNWGMSPNFILKHFNSFINGNYEYNKKYKSCMFVGYNKPIILSTNILILSNCNCNVVVPNDWVRYEIYLCGKCNILLSGNGKVLIYTNPKTNTYSVDKDSHINIKHIEV